MALSTPYNDTSSPAVHCGFGWTCCESGTANHSFPINPYDRSGHDRMCEHILSKMIDFWKRSIMHLLRALELWTETTK